MRILVDIGHPAHVHLFKNFIWEMEKRGHLVLVTAREKDVAIQLLKAYNIPFTPVGKKGTGSLNLAKEWIIRDIEITRIAKRVRSRCTSWCDESCTGACSAAS